MILNNEWRTGVLSQVGQILQSSNMASDSIDDLRTIASDLSSGMVRLVHQMHQLFSHHAILEAQHQAVLTRMSGLPASGVVPLVASDVIEIDGDGDDDIVMELPVASGSGTSGSSSTAATT